MKSILILIFSILSFSAFSQGPPLLYRHLPQAGDKVTFYEAYYDSTIKPGPTGKQNWDFTHIKDSSGPFSFEYSAMPIDTNGFPFSKANLRIIDYAYNGYEGYYPSPGSIYGENNYYHTDSDGMFSLGGTNTYKSTSGNDNLGDINKTLIGNMLVKVPLFYKDSFQSVYVDSFYSERVVVYGMDKNKYDAYGSLALPGIVFDSVIRIHNITHDSVNNLNFWSNEQYNWYDVSNNGHGFKMPIFTIAQNIHTVILPRDRSTDSRGSIAYSYNNHHVGISPVQKKIATDYIVYYNGSLNIKSTINSPNISWQIIDISGRVLRKGSLNMVENNEYHINCSGLEAGIYFFRMGDSTLKFIKP